MNSIVATNSQRYSPIESSISPIEREKLDLLSSKPSPHSSPTDSDVHKVTLPITSRPHHSSPSTMSSSSLPETRESDPTFERAVVHCKRPSSADTFPVIEKCRSNCVTNENEPITNNGKSFEDKLKNFTDDLKPSAPTSNPLDNVCQPISTMPNWTVVMQQLANICQEKIDYGTMNSTATNPVVSCETTDDPAMVVRSVLANINQLLHSKSSAMLQKLKPNERSSETEHPLPPKDLLKNAEDVATQRAKDSPADFSTVEKLAQAEHFQLPPFSPNLAPNPDAIVSAASMLALMMSSKHTGLNLVPPVSNPFIVPNFSPNSYASQQSPTRSFQPVYCTTTPQEESGAQCRLPVTTFADNRGFLYQLGQHLMAMATSPAAEVPARSSSWNFGAPVESSTLPNSTIPSFQQCNSSSFLINPMVAIMNAALLQTSPELSQNSILSTTPFTSMDKQPPFINQTVSSVEKGTQNFPPPGNMLSGISMRGNQKYSAYYQHQRKQGLQYGLTNEYGHAGSGRRQSSSNSVPFTCNRYGNRRLKGGLGNLSVNNLSSDFRGNSRTLSSRGSTAITGSNLFPNFRGAAYKHSLVNSGANSARSKIQLTSDILLNSNTNTTNENTPNQNRLRDTAFLCSCGKDFESLYGFTLHMKDTGHKPKSDQSERDIPKLVRGQDMWINSETEQTREILRCMRCHQSFRNLPELTLHMMKTNHYSEIVYNDSGRLVFVNPEEQKKANQNGATTTSASSSPSKTSPHVNKRALKTSTNAIEPQLLGNDSIDDRCEKSIRHLEKIQDKSSSRDSNSSTLSGVTESFPCLSPDQATNDRSEYKMKMESPPVQKLTNSDLHEPFQHAAHLIEDGTSISSETYSSADSSTEKRSSNFGSSVIRQIESFVESNLPQNSRSLSIRVDSCSSVTSRVSSPASALDPRASLIGSDEFRQSPSDTRKRTFSGASLSQGHSGTSSPLNATNESSYYLAAKRSNPSPTSPPRVSSSTGESNQPQAENPLSSLQKLVETTHKPHFSTVSSASTNCSNLYSFYSGAGGQPTKNAVQSTNPNKCITIAQSPRSKTPTFSSGSISSFASSSPTYAHLISPAVEGDTNIPALSALYAYVEKSSGHSSESRNLKEDNVACNNLTSRKVTDIPMDQDTHNFEQALLSPSFQALYATVLSNLTTTYLPSLTSEFKGGEVPDDPIQLFQKVAAKFGESIQPSSRHNFPGNRDLTAGWMKVLQSLGTSFSESETSSKRKANNQSEKLFSDASYKQAASGGYFGERGETVPHDALSRGTSTDNSGSATRGGNSLDGSHPSMTSCLSAFMSKVSASPQSSPPLRNSDATNFNCVPTTTNNRCNQIMAMRASSNINNPNSLMSTIITKKAKCHFCGKPFANKGQVRLHISKNKCPCLLQRSCHVAALAAAFGSESRQSQTTLACSSKANFPVSVSTPITARGINLTKDSAQLMTTDSISSCDGSIEKASALSLLKERFQNFDLASMTPIKNFGSSTAEENRKNDPSPVASTSQTEIIHNGTGSHSPLMEKNKALTGTAYSDNAKAATIAAATNAGHLAAMALLAQTLVQLTSAQVPRFSETSNNGDNFKVDNRTHLPQTANLDSNLSSTVGDHEVNWDWLFSQAHFARQLSAFNWSGRLPGYAEKDSSSSPTLTSCHGPSTPNSLS